MKNPEGIALASINTLFGIIAIIGFYLFPMFLVGHWYIQLVVSITAALAACGMLYFTWYKNLPLPGEGSAN